MQPQPKKLMTKVLEYAALFALAVILVRIAVHLLIEIWPVLLGLALLIVGGIIGYRLWRGRMRW